MVAQYRHLILPIPESFIRRKRQVKFGFTPASRDNEQFYKTEIKRLNFMKEEFERERQRYSKYFDPNLIFKIKLNEKQSVSEEILRDALKRAGIITISASPDKKGYWIAFTDDIEFTNFKTKLSERIKRDKPNFIDVIEDINDIPKDDKIGEGLRSLPIEEKEGFAYLDVEIWRMSNQRLESYIVGLSELLTERQGEVVDQLITDNFCLLRVKIDKKLFEQLIEMREVAYIDRPPRIKIESMLESDLQELKIKGKPSSDAYGILVVDSGVRHHPLLENAIIDEIAMPLKDGKITSEKKLDDVGHGTQVAGIALYGDIQSCVEKKEFKPEMWIYSAKVMYKDDTGWSRFDPKELVEHQLKDAVENIISKYLKCRVINLSIGNSANKMFEGQRQFNLASLIDELSIKFPGIIFVVSAGNNIEDVKGTENYPDYLLEKSKRIKIIDPATAVHAITVGSIFKFSRENGSSVKLDFPSPFTRVGPGLRGMIKPDLVEYGGGYNHDIVTLNHDWLQGRLFTLNSGTSFSAPKISHYLTKLMNNLPTASRNLIKGLLLSSSSIPRERPDPLGAINLHGNTKDMILLLNIYGYGKPNFEKASFSDDNRVLLVHDGTIRIDHVQFFAIYLPEQFVTEKGDKKITITLIFDPPINRNRADYLGITMESHLFRNVSLEKVRQAYSKIKIDAQEENVVPKDIKKHEISLVPGLNLRKKGAHQMASKEFKKTPKIDAKIPLVLAVVSQSKWYEEEGYEQSYSVIVTIEHSGQIDLYNQIQVRNRTRARVR